MSTESPNVSPRAAALEAARRRLRWLEVETHRMKAQLARLEAEFEDGVADTLSEYDESTVAAEETPFVDDVPALNAQSNASEIYAAATIWPPVPDQSAEGVPTSPLIGRFSKTDSPLAPARSLLASFGIHILVLLVGLPLAYMTLVHKKVPPPPAPASVVVDAPLPDLDRAELDGGAIDGLETQQAIFTASKTDIAANVLSEIPAIEPAGVATPIAPPATGLPGVTASDLGMLGTTAPVGDGGTTKGGAENGTPFGAGGRSGAVAGNTAVEFFGASSKGERFVYIVDDSSSMKDGRLEAAVAELTRSIDTMSRRQSFYVIFVSDKTYPMFYPEKAPDLLLATPENKKLLSQWLGKVRLASGKNRELITAMNLAVTLRPHAVFLLWDGDLRYSEAVRKDVMQHLAGPQPWSFAVHTLGMGSLSAESEQNLAAIAAARKGVYRRIDIPKATNR